MNRIDFASANAPVAARDGAKLAVTATCRFGGVRVGRNVVDDR